MPHAYGTEILLFLLKFQLIVGVYNMSMQREMMACIESAGTPEGPTVVLTGRLMACDGSLSCLTLSP